MMIWHVLKQVLIVVMLVLVLLPYMQSVPTPTSQPPATQNGIDEEDGFSESQYFKDCLSLTQKVDLCAEIAGQLKAD